MRILGFFGIACPLAFPMYDSSSCARIAVATRYNILIFNVSEDSYHVFWKRLNDAIRVIPQKIQYTVFDKTRINGEVDNLGTISL